MVINLKRAVFRKKSIGLKERGVEIISSISSFTSFLGSWQVCHNLCLSIIFLLSIFGITIAWMPLLFLTKVAIPIWIIAVVLLFVSLYFYIKKRCISNKLILFNSGLLIIGIPFQNLQKFFVYFLMLGGGIIFVTLVLFVKDRLRKANYEKRL